MEQPLGTEWNTRVAFQRGTLPRVVKKVFSFFDIDVNAIDELTRCIAQPGMIINPLEKLT
jgi:hypothetical protein